jgi:DNA-binding beta-propeller fold protein YncE
VDLALGEDGLIYVLNRSYENRTDGIHVTVMTQDEEYVTQFGNHGENNGEFVWPTALSTDSKGNVYLADEWLNRINVYNKDGEYLSHWGTAGSGDGELDRPAGLAVTPDGNLLISDSRNHRIQKFTLDGKFISKFGSFGDGPGQLNMPWGIGMTPDGSILVADWRNDRIQQFSADGQWEATFGESGSNVGQFNRPTSVCADKDGDIYVADWLNNRVQVLSPDGRFITEMRGDHQISRLGKEKLQSNPDMIRQRSLAMAHDANYDRDFRHPCAVKVDGQGRVVVLDHTSNRLQVYNKDAEPVLA